MVTILEVFLEVSHFAPRNKIMKWHDETIAMSSGWDVPAFLKGFKHKI